MNGSTDSQLEAMLNKMRDSAKPLAEAKAQVVYLTEYRKSLKAILFTKAPEGTVADRENYAYSHPDYLELLKGLEAATAQYEELRWRMKQAELRIDLWRTQQANLRKEMGAYGHG